MLALDPVKADEFMRQKGVIPLEPYRNCRTPWPCRCQTCGATVSPRLNNVTRKGGCRYCAVRAASLTHVVHLDAEARATMQAKGFEPEGPYPGLMQPWPGVCQRCGRRASPRYHDILRGQGACSSCARHGFRYGSPAILYVLTHPVLDAHKVGIASPLSTRLAQHRRAGWAVEKVRVYHFATGYAARRVERAILQRLRSDLGLPPHLAKPVDGWSETVSAARLPLSSLLEIVGLEVGRN